MITQTTDPREAFQFQRLLKRTMAAHWEFVWIIATLRLDFESQFQEEALKEAWMDSRFVIPPMSQAQLRAAIELPAAARVLHFEPSSLVDRLIEDVSQTPGALPLLSFTLSEMYLRYLERRSDNRALTEEDYRALGGVTGSLTQRATQEYEGLVATDAAYEQTVKHVMLRMLAVEGGELARRRVPLSELVYGNEAENQRVQTLLQTLVDARLIVRGQEGEGSEPYVEPAHDALVRGWDKLLRWKNEEQEAIALQRRLSPAAQEWALQKANKRAKGLLWNDNPRLGLLKEVMASPQNWLNQVESTFVAASVKLRRTKQRRFVGSLGSVIIALSLLSVGLVEASRNFFVSSQRNFARSLAAEADSLVSKSSVKQETGALLAVRAHQIMQNLGEESAEVNQVLRKSLEVLPDNQLLTHGESVNVVAFSSDGNSLATASDDGTAKIWTSALPEPLSESFEPDNISAEGLEETFAEAHTLEHGGKVRAIAFNPNRDRSQVVTAGDNKIAQVWDTTTGERLGQVTHQRPVSLAMFSPGKDEGAGKLVATASDLNVLVWEAMTGEGTFAFTAKKPITAMSFSPDGKRIAIARGKGNVGIWSLETQKEVFSLDYLSEIHALAFSPDGKRLATASENRLAIVVNIQSDAKQFPDAEQQSDAKQFPDTEQQSDEKQSSDTKQQSDEEQSLDAKQQSGEKQSSDTKQQSDEKQSSDERQLAGLKLRHQSVVKDVAFSPDGKRIATASYDETARVWDALTGDPIAKFDHEDEVKTVSFSPDGNRLATTSWNEAAQVWDIETGKASETLSHKELVTAVSFSDNSARVATASKDGTAKVWNTMAPTADHQLVHEEAVRGVSFSPNEDDSR
ncbi:MAG: WD40 repeat domain-containing protein, partial [Cyanobacteria bacterium P01_G01_bin.4]